MNTVHIIYPRLSWHTLEDSESIGARKRGNLLQHYLSCREWLGRTVGGDEVIIHWQVYLSRVWSVTVSDLPSVPSPLSIILLRFSTFHCWTWLQPPSKTTCWLHEWNYDRLGLFCIDRCIFCKIIKGTRSHLMIWSDEGLMCTGW